MYLIVKRIVDVLISIIAILLFSPLFLIIIIWIKLDSPGPVFFLQKRMGYRGKIFRILKFRTMVKDADKMKVSIEQVRKWEAEGNDPRVTRVGRWLRKIRILDELPQFLNVLKGDMSLVGPRPYYLPRIEADPSLKKRFDVVKPGCISLAIVNGGVHLSEEEIKKYDKEYQEKQGLWMDIKILLKAVYLVSFGKKF